MHNYYGDNIFKFRSRDMLWDNKVKIKVEVKFREVEITEN